MRLNWVLLFQAARTRRFEQHPLADPLERPEWQGREYVIRLLCRLVRIL